MGQNFEFLVKTFFLRKISIFAVFDQNRLVFFYRSEILIKNSKNLNFSKKKIFDQKFKILAHSENFKSFTKLSAFVGQEISKTYEKNSLKSADLI